MATPTIIPSAPATGPGTPEPTPTPVTPTPASPAAPVPTPTPATGSPAPGAPDPAAPAVPTPDEALLSVLADDLKVDAPVAAPAADPLAALQDNPRVKELVASETAFKALLTKSPYIKEPQHIEAAIQDADALWQIIDGKIPVANLLENARKTSPQAFPQILADLKKYVETVTGQPIAAAAAGAPTDPAMAKIAELEKTINAQRDAEKQQAFTKRLTAGQGILKEQIAGLVKDSWINVDGAPDRILGQIANILSPDPSNLEQVLTQLERGDFTAVQKAVRTVMNREAQWLDKCIKSMVAIQKRKAEALPKQPTSGAPAAPATPETPGPVTDAETRRKGMLAAYRGEA